MEGERVMERYTMRLPDDLGAVPVDGYGTPEIIDRLAAYEDTGLEPEEITNLFGEPITDKPPRKPRDKAKAAWEAAFQRWSDKSSQDDKAEHYGKCGYGRICNYCDDSSKGRPCVRALNAMAKEKKIKINYAERDFERWF